MFGLFKKKEPELSDHAKYLLELFKRDEWEVRDRYDRYLCGTFGGTYIEIANAALWSDEIRVRVGERFFHRTDAALQVPLSQADQDAIRGPFYRLNSRLCAEAAKQEDNKAIDLLSARNSTEEG
jgi:hypothetical protein